MSLVNITTIIKIVNCDDVTNQKITKHTKCCNIYRPPILKLLNIKQKQMEKDLQNFNRLDNTVQRLNNTSWSSSNLQTNNNNNNNNNNNIFL